jgi:glycerophosphoryl diester phosphodiesterase
MAWFRATWPLTLAACAALAAAPATAFDLQGHRGARGLAPENTLAAFEKALRVGVDTLEMDVHLSADGVPMVSHDPALNPDLTRDASGQWIDAPGPLIRALSAAQLQRFDLGRARPGSAVARNFSAQQASDGERMPRLAEVFALCQRLGASHARFNIEIKTYPDRPDDTPEPAVVAQAMLQVIAEAGVQRRVSIQSFDWRALQAVHALSPQTPTVALSAQGLRFDTVSDGRWTAGLRLADHVSLPAMVRALGAKVWSPAQGDLRADLVAQAHALGLIVLPWTVNDPSAMERLIDWGVDGLITDRPDLAREVLAKRSMALPRKLAETPR